MEHLHTILILLLLFGSPWPSAGTTYVTYLGTRCMDDCKASWGEYKCKTIDKDGKCQTMYCSPQENKDYWGRECAFSICGKHGENYYWCKTDLFSWGYCGLVTDDMNHYGSKTDALCYDQCEKREQDYFWCNTDQGWNYCSPFKNTDYRGKECKADHPCGKNGAEYHWCKLKEGSWGYCGLVEPKMFVHRSRHHYVCMDECQYYESGNYYWCHIANDWDYCSPDVDVTYKGIPCRSDHSCGLHELNYNWCWTSQSEYGYCGPIESGECTYITSRRRNKRAPGDPEIICDIGNNQKITFTFESDTNRIADGSHWRNEAENLISRWDNGYLVDQARSNLLHSDNLRIDMQGSINRNNQLYYNLQIQVNVRRTPGQSTTVSQVIVPRGIPRRYIRRAFVESLRRRARVFIDVSRINQC